MKLWDNIKNIMTIPEEDDYEEEETFEEEPQKTKKAEEPVKRENPKLIKSRNAAAQAQKPQMQVVLVKPDRYEDVTDIADHLNERRTVILNLESSNRDTSRRILDFLSGVAYANRGDIKKVANNTFIIAAHNVDVTGEANIEDYEDGKLYF